MKMRSGIWNQESVQIRRYTLMRLLFQLFEQIPPIFPKECMVLKPKEQKLIKVKAPFIDEISGLSKLLKY